MRFKTLIQELHRRHVLKAAVAYMVVTWLIVQVLSILIPAFEFPYQTLQISILLMIIGFPIWLLINWFYDITEEGIIRVSKQDYESETLSKKNVNLNKVIIVTLSIIVVVLLVNIFRMKADHPGSKADETSMIPELNYSVAVLAFDDMSPKQDKEYFADGMAEEILNRLAKCKDLKVIGRTSSFSYKNKEVTHEVIGKELDVSYILEGSVRQSGDIFRITAQLIDVSDGSHIWSDTFDRTMEDALLVQDEIAAIVADRMEVTLLNEELRERKIDPEAYELYLEALESVRRYDESSTLIADSLIRRALEIDMSYAPSWSLLSRVIFRKTYDYFILEPESGIELGKQAAIKAIELDSTNSEGYTWLSLFAWQNKQVDISEEYLNKALNMAPNDPSITFQAANFAIRTNRHMEGKKFLDKTIFLDPKNKAAYYSRGFLNWSLGNLNDAEIDLLKAYKLGLPDFFKNYEMSQLYRDKGDIDKAIEWKEKEENPYLQKFLNCSIYHAMGKKSEALELLDQIKNYPQDDHWKQLLGSEAEHNFSIACLYAYMDDRDNAFNYLDNSFEHVLIWPEWLFTMPEFNNLHEDPRWAQYVERLGKEFNYDFLYTEE